MTMMQPHLPWVFLVSVAFIFGTLIGSFLNVVIFRVPKGDSILWPNSHCPRCSTPLNWWENIPLLSYVLLRGRCRTCHEAISWRYPLVEGMTGVLWAGLMAQNGPSLQFLAQSALASVLIVIFWIDLDTMLILDVITIPGIVLGILYGGGFGLGWGPHIGAALAGYAFFRLIEWGSERVLGVAGMGRGDAKLAALMGAWLGPSGLAIALLIAFGLGSIVGIYLRMRAGESQPYPFGPSLVVGALISLFVGQTLWSWYLRMVWG